MKCTAEQLEELEGLRKDAERYRFLKTEVIAHHDTVFLAALAEPDSFIDAAIAERAGPMERPSARGPIRTQTHLP